MADTKNLCAQIPVALHQKITEDKETTGLTLNQYIEKLITEYYEMRGNKNMAATRTLAFKSARNYLQELKSTWIALHTLHKKHSSPSLL